MCGIFGFSGFIEEGLLARMGDSLAHRGPDGRGCYEDEAHRFYMGMRRLSIIDLEGGSQPIYNEDRSMAVCFNGEIYNYIELHDQLVQRGHTFRTRSDTEVIVHAYEEWGRECVKQFNGMFAFALHDSRTGETFFARDRCGQKPFYYHQSNGRFVFASEVKAHPGVRTGAARLQRSSNRCLPRAPLCPGAADNVRWYLYTCRRRISCS